MLLPLLLPTYPKNSYNMLMMEMVQALLVRCPLHTLAHLTCTPDTQAFWLQQTGFCLGKTAWYSAPNALDAAAIHFSTSVSSFPSDVFWEPIKIYKFRHTLHTSSRCITIGSVIFLCYTIPSHQELLIKLTDNPSPVIFSNATSAPVSDLANNATSSTNWHSSILNSSTPLVDLRKSCWSNL